MRSKQSGFTLVEIAIVLVVIGLLLGGVLKGQELITQAKIKNVANDLNGISAAVYAYQDRYRALPGDDPNADARWTLGGAYTITQNGQIGGTYETGTTNSESRAFWRHLRASGLIAGDSASDIQPLNAVGGILGAQQGAPAGVDRNGNATQALAGQVICAANLPGKIANALDSQFDDGFPGSGPVRGYNQNGGNNPPLAGLATGQNYVDDGATLYVVCKQL